MRELKRLEINLVKYRHIFYLFYEMLISLRFLKLDWTGVSNDDEK